MRRSKLTLTPKLLATKVSAVIGPTGMAVWTAVESAIWTSTGYGTFLDGLVTDGRLMAWTSASEVAATAGIGHRTAQRWLAYFRRVGFLDPVAQVGNRYAYDLGRVEQHERGYPIRKFFAEEALASLTTAQAKIPRRSHASLRNPRLVKEARKWLESREEVVRTYATSREVRTYATSGVGGYANCVSTDSHAAPREEEVSSETYAPRSARNASASNSTTDVFVNTKTSSVLCSGSTSFSKENSVDPVRGSGATPFPGGTTAKAGTACRHPTGRTETREEKTRAVRPSGEEQFLAVLATAGGAPVLTDDIRYGLLATRVRSHGWARVCAALAYALQHWPQVRFRKSSEPFTLGAFLGPFFAMADALAQEEVASKARIQDAAGWWLELGRRGAGSAHDA